MLSAWRAWVTNRVSGTGTQNHGSRRPKTSQQQTASPGSTLIQAGGDIIGGWPRPSAVLPCHGCAHSAAGGPFPGQPSGERPCGFCIRNPGDRFLMDDPLWYDGETPSFKTPMDCYIATDRLQQQRIFDELDRLKRTGEEPPGRTRWPSLEDPRHYVYCCDGGEGPGGHTWTCWRWLGLSFG